MTWDTIGVILDLLTLTILVLFWFRSTRVLREIDRGLTEMDRLYKIIQAMRYILNRIAWDRTTQEMIESILEKAGIGPAGPIRRSKD